MNILITGIDGFIGSHLAEHLLENNELVWGLIRHDSVSRNIEQIETMLNLIEGDILDLEALQSIIKSVKPDVIVHLAGQTAESIANDRPHQTLQTNILGALNILESVRKDSPETKIVFGLSCDLHGKPAAESLPICEKTPLEPDTPLATSHATIDMIARQFAKSYDMNIVIARILSVVGPRQSSKFVLSDFANKICRAKLGLGDGKIVVGNISTERDFIDVRDVARAIYTLSGNPTKHPVYTICSGRKYLLRDLLNKLMEIADVKYPVDIRPDKIGNSDVPVIVGTPKLLEKEFGFKAMISIEQSLYDLYQYWLRKLERNDF